MDNPAGKPSYSQEDKMRVMAKMMRAAAPPQQPQAPQGQPPMQQPNMQQPPMGQPNMQQPPAQGMPPAGY